MMEANGPKRTHREKSDDYSFLMLMMYYYFWLKLTPFNKESLLCGRVAGRGMLENHKEEHKYEIKFI